MATPSFRKSMPPLAYGLPDSYLDRRRTSFEAEDGPAILRTFSAPNRMNQRLSCNLQKSDPELRNSGKELRFLMDPILGSSQLFDSSSPNVKRNHSLKVSQISI